MSEEKPVERVYDPIRGGYTTPDPVLAGEFLQAVKEWLEAKAEKEAAEKSKAIQA